MSTSTHRSIGEVLALLQGEFEDITISKIRFLESQGLIDPERTPSGYRKFTEADVERLRWILRQQREHFLPLKVIKDRLDDGEVDFEALVEGETHDRAPSTEGDADGTDPGVAVATEPDPPQGGRVSILEPCPQVRLTVEQLCEASGLTARNISELERYGLLSAADGDGRVYDHDALVVARAAGALRAQGVEARHLRMYKVAAEREAGYYEQLLMPMLKRKSPKGRREALETLDGLLAQADLIRGSLLRQAFGEHLPPS